jgi:phospholipid transport system substrate-binding protein
MPTSAERLLVRRRTLLATLAVLPLALSSGATLAANADAESFIRLIGDEVMVILKDESKGADAKLAALKELLDHHTDLDLVARLVLGRHWRDASAQEQADYVELFRQILMNTMAERIGDYNGQTFTVVGSSQLNERDSAVQSQINRTNGAPPLRVDWRVRETDGGFAIIDVIAEGVSLVVSQRNEVGSVVERQGMTGLIETMRERSSGGATVL